ncbi:MAG: prepilin-type N-terminal cleavage/methylation domain-containing protein [Phycisphaerae bacterium]|nr:prepilin-type N-terminal cleavage/methylation domain-containing protein [Phycisphaerae bacterium]
MTPRHQNQNRRKGNRRGFTLVEALMTILLLSVGLAAVMGAVNLGIRNSGEGAVLTQGVFLAQEIRERTLNMNFADVAALDGTTYGPPINSHGETISGMSGWSQAVQTSYRSPNDPSVEVGVGASDLVYVQVQVAKDGNVRLTTGWLVARKE